MIFFITQILREIYFGEYRTQKLLQLFTKKAQNIWNLWISILKCVIVNRNVMKFSVKLKFLKRNQRKNASNIAYAIKSHQNMCLVEFRPLFCKD